MKQKLELTWIGKNNPPNVEPRILIHDKNFDYGDENSKNILIHGDITPATINPKFFFVSLYSLFISAKIFQRF